MEFNFDDKTILITGGTGSWGQEFTRQILGETKIREVRIYSRGEHHQVEMRRAFRQESRLKFIIGEVRDKDRLFYAAEGVHGIIHLAALKHVPVVEEHPWEALQTNTIGSQYVIEAAHAKAVERVLFVSSDKAVDPLNFYGVTKLAAERLMVAANASGYKSKFITYRAGNVMGSAGSVIPVFQAQLLNENLITVTDPKMTRFFASKREMVRKALKAFRCGIGGELFVPKMKAATLELLSSIMVENLGNANTRIERIAVRPGEKESELLISRHEASRLRELRDMWIILPFFPSPDLNRKYKRPKKVRFSEYASNEASQFSRVELETLLREEGFLSRSLPSSSAPLYFKKDKAVFH